VCVCVCVCVYVCVCVCAKGPYMCRALNALSDTLYAQKRVSENPFVRDCVCDCQVASIYECDMSHICMSHVVDALCMCRMIISPLSGLPWRPVLGEGV